jgi:hypothetical protein
MSGIPLIADESGMNGIWNSRPVEFQAGDRSYAQRVPRHMTRGERELIGRLIATKPFSSLMVIGLFRADGVGGTSSIVSSGDRRHPSRVPYR